MHSSRKRQQLVFYSRPYCKPPSAGLAGSPTALLMVSITLLLTNTCRHARTNTRTHTHIHPPSTHTHKHTHLLWPLAMWVARVLVCDWTGQFRPLTIIFSQDWCMPIYASMVFSYAIGRVFALLIGLNVNPLNGLPHSCLWTDCSLFIWMRFSFYHSETELASTKPC